MSLLEFIKDKELRETLKNSIDYVLTLVVKSKNKREKRLFREETYRVIILYVISTIEAVFLYFYKERGEKIEKIDYKHIEFLPKEYVFREKNELPVVIAVQEKTEKKDHQINLRELASHFRSKKLIEEKIYENIIELNDIRNSFHFCKPRTKRCDIAMVESALELLSYAIKKAPIVLKTAK